MKRSISALSVSRARERQVKRFSPKCRHNHPIDVSYCTRFIQRYYLLSLSSPSFSLFFSSLQFSSKYFRIPHIPNIYLLRTLTKLRREFLLKCQLIKSSALICTFLAYIPLVIFRTCRVFFSSFCTSRGFIISPIQETYKKRLSRRYVTHVRSLRAIMSEDEFVELLSR